MFDESDIRWNVRIHPLGVEIIGVLGPMKARVILDASRTETIDNARRRMAKELLAAAYLEPEIAVAGAEYSYSYTAVLSRPVPTPEMLAYEEYDQSDD